MADSKYTTIGEDRDAAVYTPYLQQRGPDRLVHLLVRTAGSPTASLATVRSAIARLDPDAANAIEPLDAALGFAFLPSRIGAVLIGALGILGVVLARIGLYGVISFAGGPRCGPGDNRRAEFCRNGRHLERDEPAGGLGARRAVPCASSRR